MPMTIDMKQNQPSPPAAPRAGALGRIKRVLLKGWGVYALLALATLGVTILSCVDDATSIQVMYAMGGQPDENCEVSESDTEKGGGSVDLALTSRYYAAFWVTSRLDSTTGTAGGDTVSQSSRNDYYVNELAINYECKDATSKCSGFPAIPEQVIQRSGLLQAGGSLYMGINLITSYAAEQIAGFLSTSNQSVNVNVKFVIRGTFASGSKKNTTEYVFPIEFYASSFNWPDLTKYDLGPAEGAKAPACSNWGQDRNYPMGTCKSDCGGCASLETCDTDQCVCVAQ